MKYSYQLENVITEIRNHKKNSKKIVFTNGVFDILHVGHTRYLSEASTLGDILVIGINSDDSVRKLKGPSRPINQLED
jgi:D-beta-D-heptose 7-phosphate kinase/D-beta-D-heptose 1-phosphate adenosyltransferase